MTVTDTGQCACGLGNYCSERFLVRYENYFPGIRCTACPDRSYAQTTIEALVFGADDQAIHCGHSLFATGVQIFPMAQNV